MSECPLPLVATACPRIGGDDAQPAPHASAPYLQEAQLHPLDQRQQQQQQTHQQQALQQQQQRQQQQQQQHSSQQQALQQQRQAQLQQQQQRQAPHEQLPSQRCCSNSRTDKRMTQQGTFAYLRRRSRKTAGRSATSSSCQVPSSSRQQQQQQQSRGEDTQQRSMRVQHRDRTQEKREATQQWEDEKQRRHTERVRPAAASCRGALQPSDKDGRGSWQHGNMHAPPRQQQSSKPLTLSTTPARTDQAPLSHQIFGSPSQQQQQQRQQQQRQQQQRQQQQQQQTHTALASGGSGAAQTADGVRCNDSHTAAAPLHRDLTAAPSDGSGSSTSLGLSQPAPTAATLQQGPGVQQHPEHQQQQQQRQQQHQGQAWAAHEGQGGQQHPAGSLLQNIGTQKVRIEGLRGPSITTTTPPSTTSTAQQLAGQAAGVWQAGLSRGQMQPSRAVSAQEELQGFSSGDRFLADHFTQLTAGVRDVPLDLRAGSGWSPSPKGYGQNAHHATAPRVYRLTRVPPGGSVQDLLALKPTDTPHPFLHTIHPDEPHSPGTALARRPPESAPPQKPAPTLPSELVQVAYQMAKNAHHHTTFSLLVVRRVLRPGAMSSLEPDRLMQLAWALARSQVYDNRLEVFKNISLAVQRHGSRRLSHHLLCELMWAFSSLHIEDGKLMRWCAKKLDGHVSELHTAEIVGVLPWSSSRRGELRARLSPTSVEKLVQFTARHYTLHSQAMVLFERCAHSFLL
ncbi:MAG: hypothetical protein WDW38_009865 [Sanguina aurantia]